MTKTTFSLTSALLLGMSYSAAQGSERKVQGASADQVRATLREIQESAVGAADKAGLLEQRGADLGMETQYDQLIALKDDVNAMGREIGTLDAESASLAPWEKQAVDKVEPLLREAAVNTQKAIEFFNGNKSSLWVREYRSDVSTAARDSEQIAKTLKDYLKFAKTQDEEQHLKQVLEGGGQ